MRPVTINDVAKRAQVSVATVSRVVNGSPNVRPELARRVMRAVEALNYRPNRLARNLRTNSTQTIAMVIPDIENPFFVSVVRGVEDVAFREGYSVLVCNTNDDVEREATHLRILSDESVAGMVISTADERRGNVEARKLLEKRTAVVAVDRRLEDAPVDSVLSDNFGGSRLGVSHLIELGHCRIGLIAGPDRFAPGRERRMGYEQALLDSGLAIDPALIQRTNFKAAAAETATDTLLDLPNPPTALFVCSGHSSLGVLRAVNRRGIKIPAEVSIVIFDDLDWEEAYNPPLTAIAQPAKLLGVTSADLLIRRLRGAADPPHERRLPTQLMIRQSTQRVNVARSAVKGS